jgi:hypothetical protein
MPATKPRPGLPAGIKFNPANGSRAELDAEGVMSRLEKGMSQTRACQGFGGPRLFRIYCDLHPGWAKRAQALIDRNIEAGRFRKGANWRRSDPRHCRRGHDLTIPGNVRETKRNRIDYVECKVCARENAKFRGKLLSAEKRAAVMQAMARKARFETIKTICDSNSFYRQRRRDPEFAAAADQWLVGSYDRQGKRVSAACAKRRYAKVDALVPARLAADVRLEIISMIFVALGKHRYRGKDFFLNRVAANMKHFIADYYKENPMQAYGKIDSPWSLDETVPGTDGLRRIDTVSEGLW